MTTFVHWPSIASFDIVRRASLRNPDLLVSELGDIIPWTPGEQPTRIHYRAKVKVHGMCGAVQVTRDGLVAQGRETILGTEKNDNKGFGRWVQSPAVREAFLASREIARHDMIYFGEWCGPRIMDSVAVNQIPNKTFAIFAAAALPLESWGAGPLRMLPSFLELLLAPLLKAGLAHVLPWHGPEIAIPVLGTPEELQPILDTINADVLAVEACDPWVKSAFGIEGIGEGLVFYPLGATLAQFTNFAFKAKGEKHRIVAKAEPVQIDPSVAASLDEFVTMVLTEPRLEQGARAVASGDLVFDKRNIGPFLGWIGKDVEKECSAELEASGLTWQLVEKPLSRHARAWYLGRTS